MQLVSLWLALFLICSCIEKSWSNQSAYGPAKTLEKSSTLTSLSNPIFIQYLPFRFDERSISRRTFES